MTLTRASVLDLLLSQRRALHRSEIASRLSIAPRQTAALDRVLDDLCFDGSIVPLAGQRFRVSKKQVGRPQTVIEGFVHAHPRGFGFVSAEELGDDLFIPAEAMGGALHRDRVAVRVVGQSKRGYEGAIERVIERRNPRVAGIVRRRGKSSWFEPDDTRLRGPMPLRTEPGGPSAADGEAAVATIHRFPELADELPEVTLIAVLGNPGEPNVEVAKVLLRESVEEDFSETLLTEVANLPPEIDDEAQRTRVDFTDIPLPTIDPEDARDHDDAVWAVRTETGGYRAWIAIADVSHFVRPDTALDGEARARGCSIYLPDRAIPMLPFELSSDRCSLKPHVPRLCLCVIIELDAGGHRTGFSIHRGIMKSAARLTYPGVARALGFTEEVPRDDAAEAMRSDLEVLWDLARVLRTQRIRRGALTFDVPEPRLELDPETGAPVSVKRRTHDPGIAKAYQLVEELMLLANETVAEFLTERGAPTIFRNHGRPDEQKLERFAALCAELGIPFDPAAAEEPKRLAAFMKKLSGHENKEIVSAMLVRSMQQAVYRAENTGHFGLASKAYLHFTSPIRRYPDLVVHRAVKALLDGQPADRSPKRIEALREAAMVSSERERHAMDVEREVMDLYRCILMRSEIGSLVEGRVSAVVGSGVFVTLDEPFVDVLVPLEALGPDDYKVDDVGLGAYGSRSGDRVGLGDRMLVEITDVALQRRAILGRRVFDPAERRDRKDRKRRTAKGKEPASKDKARDKKGRGKKGRGKGGRR